MKFQFEWHFQADASMKEALEDKMQIVLSDLDELQPCHPGSPKIAIGSSDYGFSRIGGNIRCQCGKPLAKFAGNSDASKMQYKLVRSV
jgi:hypothetical protein